MPPTTVAARQRACDREGGGARGRMLATGGAELVAFASGPPSGGARRGSHAPQAADAARPSASSER